MFFDEWIIPSIILQKKDKLSVVTYATRIKTRM
jgi:hypothetical protein